MALTDNSCLITPVQSEMRRRAVAQVYGRWVTSGRKVTAAEEALLSRYIEGELTCEQLSAALSGQLAPLAS